MSIPALDRKLLREISRLKGPIATIALVLAAGITSFIALLGAYASLDRSREIYYDRYRFAHVFANVERAPESVARQIEGLPGVAVAQTRISKEVTLPIEGMSRPAYGRLLSLPSAGEPSTNALYLRMGRLPERGNEEEAAVLEPFAEAHGLRPGHQLPAVINGKLRRLRVVGIVLSPEFVYAIRPGAIADDRRRYAVIWMNRDTLASAFAMDGAFTDITLRLQPGASDAAVRERVDRILRPYGSDGSVDRAHQLSNRILKDELGQLEAIAGMVPAVFLGVAAFLINMVLGRLITLQRPEIAALKAIGYTNRELGRHFLGLAFVIMVPAGLLGIVGGAILGHIVLDLYGGIFRFPALAFDMSAGLVSTALLVSSAAATSGALVAVYRSVQLPPAEAMRPPAPSRYRRSLLERIGVGKLLGPSGMMILRELQRRPLRTALSAFGMAGAMALIVLGYFGVDSLDRYLESTLLREQRQTLSVAFVNPLSKRAVTELAHMPGVLSAEGMRVVPVRVRFEHRMRDSTLIGLPEGAALRRIIARGGAEVAVPEDGLIASKVFGDVLGLRPGDRVELEVREGDRPTVRPIVVGFVDDAVGMQLYGRAELVASLERDLGAVSGALLAVEAPRVSDVVKRLRDSPNVIDVSDLHEDVQHLREMNGAAMDVWAAVSVTLSVCIIFGVVYNNARISLAMRSRDLASLRVLGMSRGEISSILIGGLAVEVLLALPLGLVFGRLWAAFFMRSIDPESFRWSMFISPKTYLLAIVVTVLASSASALWVRRHLDRLDLVGVLKTRE